LQESEREEKDLKNQLKEQNTKAKPIFERLGESHPKHEVEIKIDDMKLAFLQQVKEAEESYRSTQDIDEHMKQVREHKSTLLRLTGESSARSVPSQASAKESPRPADKPKGAQSDSPLPQHTPGGPGGPGGPDGDTDGGPDGAFPQPLASPRNIQVELVYGEEKKVIQSSGQSFAELAKACRTAFGIDSGRAINLTYQDDQGDTIPVSSDPELSAAIAQGRTVLIRVSHPKAAAEGEKEGETPGEID